MNNKKENNDKNQLVDRLIEAKRVTKVVKGGRKFSFTATVVSGDKNGYVGYGSGKANEVSDAKKKAVQDCKKNFIRVPIYQNRTIHYDVDGKFGASKVIIRKARPGTGIIAGGAMRAVFELLGIHDVVAKSLGSSNPSTMISATFDALSKLNNPRKIAEKRSKNISEIVYQKKD